MTAESLPPSPRSLRRRWPLLAVLAIGAFVWKNGFGLFPTERELAWRLPVPTKSVRRVELQVWAEETLLKREERLLANGLTEELISTVALARGEHVGIASVWFDQRSEPQVFRIPFRAQSDHTVVLEPATQHGAVGSSGR